MGIVKGETTVPDRTTPRVLVVASEAREFRVILRKCGSINDLDLPIAFAKEATLNLKADVGQLRLTCVANGPGPTLASRALQLARGKERFDAVISTGFCGGLDAKLRVGDIVVATRVLDSANQRQYDCRTVSTTLPYHSGVVLSQDSVAVNASEKSLLFQQSAAIAVEMEAAVVARAASDWCSPFYCVRSVSDIASESFDINMNEIRDVEGRFSHARILASALQAPQRRFPELLRIHRNCRAAESSLGEFFADCRFV